MSSAFDVFCFTNTLSFSDCLYSGPYLLTKLFDILIRFRFHSIAILADMKQAFVKVEIACENRIILPWIAKEHRDYLPFLWYDVISEIEAKITIYRFLRVVAGVTSSPFLLNGTIRHHLRHLLQKIPWLHLISWCEHFVCVSFHKISTPEN